MDLDEIQSRAGAGHPDLPDRATAAPYGQDSSIIAQVEVAPPPPEAIASDHRATAGCAPTQFWRFVSTRPQQLPSSHRSHPNKRRGKHPSYGLFSRIHEDRAGSSGFVGNSHEPEVHAGYRDPSPRWLSSDDPRKPIRKSATPSTGRPRLARSRRRGRNASRSASRSRRRCRRAAPSRCDGRPPVKAGKTARIIASALKFARVILDKTL